jgi:phage terminase large subunit-like protein
MIEEPKSLAELLLVEKGLREIERRHKESAIDFYVPYPKQQEFHDYGSSKRERLFMAGNQVGKTFCGGAEISYHLTGLYPDWWLGKRWDRPTRGWVAGVTGESTRDNPQRILMGTVANGIGTGSIPKRCLDRDKITLARGVSNLYDTVLVKHFGPDGKSDGWSELKYKSYERGREKWQGDTLDFVWFDEEPDEDIYGEGLTRLREGGMVFVTFTPLLGRSKVVLRYIQPDPHDPGAKDRVVINMTLDDAKHFSAEEKEKRLSGYAAHEREARAKGVPILGSGLIFHTPEEKLKVEDFKIPIYWAKLWGLDFGVGHPFGAVLIAWDKDMDVIYVVKCYRAKDQMPLQHAAAMKPALNGFGWQIPCAWPQDGWQRQEFEGTLKPVALIYKARGLKMLPDHAKFPDGSNSTEAGIMEMQERMDDGRFKVFASCTEWFDEYRFYHREDGAIVKVEDDLMSASRVAVMDKRHARIVEMGPGGSQGKVQIAQGVDQDAWGAS